MTLQDGIQSHLTVGWVPFLPDPQVTLALQCQSGQEPYVTYCCHTETPPPKTVPQHLVFQEPTLCFVSPWWSSMRFQHWVLLHLQRQSFLRIQHITKAQRSWMTQHSLWELGPLDILTSSCQRTWTKTKKNQSTLAIISLRISQVQWLVWRAVQTPLVSGSCLPRKKSCAICSEFIKCKILFPSLLFSCPPGRQNPRGSINNSISFIFLILSSFALFFFLLLSSFSSSSSLLLLPLIPLFSLHYWGQNGRQTLPRGQWWPGQKMKVLCL